MPTDAKTDIYAFGMTLKTILNHFGIKGYLLKIAEKCTRLDPAQRYNNASAVKRALKLGAFKIGLIIAAFMLALAVCIGIYSLPDTQIEDNGSQNQKLIDKSEQASEEKPLTSRTAETESDNETEKNSNAAFIGFEVGTLESAYCKPENTEVTGVFDTDSPYEHLIFVEDMNKKGKIRFGKSESYVNADITLSNGILTVALDDEKGHTFNGEFKYDGVTEYTKYYTDNLSRNADVICHDFDSDGYR